MKSLLAVVLLTSSINASADAWSGAMMGIGQAGTTYGNNLEAERRAERQQQYEIEREQRIEAAIQAKRERQLEYERQEKIRERQEINKEAAREIEIYHKYQEEYIARHHPDYNEVLFSQGFNDWLETLPLTTKEKINSTWDGVYISEKLSEFKEYQSKHNKHKPKRTHS